MYRPRGKGGLGVHNVQCKALAILIRSFLETAVNPKFIKNHYHNALFRWHVLDDKTCNEPRNCPYYSSDFYSSIRQMVQDRLMNIATMSTKQWYLVLMENNITMELDADLRQVWKPVKCEIKLSSVTWDRSWELACLRGLSSDQTSFIFKLLHNILPTGSRLHRLKQRESTACTLCTSGLSDDCVHSFLTCSFNNGVNNWVIEFSRKLVPNCSLEDIICFNLHLANSVSFPLIWSLSHVFYTVWQLRLSKKTVNLYNIRAEIEAKVNILHKSRLFGAVHQIESLLNL